MIAKIKLSATLEFGCLGKALHYHSLDFPSGYGAAFCSGTLPAVTRPRQCCRRAADDFPPEEVPHTPTHVGGYWSRAEIVRGVEF